jgi:hypothetical protein
MNGTIGGSLTIDGQRHYRLIDINVNGRLIVKAPVYPGWGDSLEGFSMVRGFVDTVENLLDDVWQRDYVDPYDPNYPSHSPAMPAVWRPLVLDQKLASGQVQIRYNPGGAAIRWGDYPAGLFPAHPDNPNNNP